jgi:hypothetical protein
MTQWFQSYATPPGLPRDEWRDFLSLDQTKEEAIERVRLQISRGAASGYVKQGFEVVAEVHGAPDAPLSESA